MKKLIIFVVALVLVSCQSDVSLISTGDEIPNKVRDNIDETLVKLNQAITESDNDLFNSLVVPGTEELNNVYYNEFINNGRLFIDFFLEKNIHKESHFYITDITKDGESVAYGQDGYNFKIPKLEGAEGSRYVYLVEGAYNNFDILLTVIFAENNGSFKIERFTLGDIRPYGEKITTLIEEAEKQEADKNMISAWQFNELAAQFVSPSPYVYYGEDKRISDNMERVAGVISEDLTFPMDVKLSDQTTVKLYAVVSNKYDDGFYCRVIYVSNLAEKDANADIIKNEAKILHEKASEILKGLGQGFDGRILYTAYFEEPLEQGKDYKTITVDLK